MRPTGTFSVPVTAAGERPSSVSSLVLGITVTHSLASAMILVSSLMLTSFLSLTVRPWEWQRMELTRTQMPSTGMVFFVPRILLVSTMPFHSSRLWPFFISESIQGRRLAASGWPKTFLGKALSRSADSTHLSSSRAAVAGLARSFFDAAPTKAICSTSSRMLLAPAPEAAW